MALPLHLPGPHPRRQTRPRVQGAPPDRRGTARSIRVASGPRLGRMDPTRSSSSLARRARPFRRGAPLVATAAAALVLTAGCTGGTQKTTAPGQSPADRSVTVEHGPDGSSVTVDHGPDGSVSIDDGSVHVSGDAGSISVQRNPDGSVTVNRPGEPPLT